MTQLTKRSLLVRLRNEARKQNFPANLMLLLYFQERLLARIAVSPYRDNFVLKGGLNLYSRYRSAARPTRDIDLAGQNVAHTSYAIRQAIESIAKQDLHDGVNFDYASMSIKEIIESANYKGLRLEIRAHFEDAFEVLQIDLSFGNAITPEPVELNFPSLLFDTNHTLLAYPIETIISEKIAAAVELVMVQEILPERL